MPEQRQVQYEQVAEVDPATAAKALAGMRDIAVAEPVSWHPATAGWYVLFALLVLAAARLGWTLWRRWQLRAYRRRALAELADLENALADPDARAHAIARINVLVKRVRLSASPRSAVASLSGSAWLKDLDATWGGARFSAGPGRLLADGPYRKYAGDRTVPESEVRELTTLAREWIRGHRA